MPRVEYEKLSSERLGESSAAVRERVEAARDRQRAWFGAAGGVHVESATHLMSNADLGGVKRSSLRIK